MFASLEGNELIDKKTMEAAAAKREAVMEVAGLLIADHKKIAEAQAEIVKRNTQIEALTPWMSLEVAMNYPGTKKTAMLLGTMAAETTLEMIYGKLAEDHPEIEAVNISVISQDKDAVYLSVFCMKDQAADVENTLRTADSQDRLYRQSRFRQSRKKNWKNRSDRSNRQLQISGERSYLTQKTGRN